jgi:AraC-like DNA-binding protein
MARTPREPAIASSLVPALVRYASLRGVDPALLCERLGIAADAASRDEVLVPATTVRELFDAAADALGEPFLALRLPAEMPLRRYGLAELAARSSATLREGLVRMARYASLVYPGIECTLEEADGEARWTQRTPGHARGLGRHPHEYGLAYVLSHAREQTGSPFAASRVWFAHARPPDLAPLYRFFATRELDFGAEASGFAFSLGELEHPMKGDDPRLLATAEDLAELALRAQPRAGAFAAFASIVAARLEPVLTDDASIEAVARGLHMSPRTLQRRLDEEGTRFSEVVDSVRERLAREWLRDESRTLSEIGYALGFADLATFSRAFKRWTGKPPGAWRRV